MRKPDFVSIIVALSLAACGSSDHDVETADAASPEAGDASNPPNSCAKLDLVIVIDDSQSMAEEQASLGTGFLTFANLLSTYTGSDGQPLDFRVAVTTTGRTIDYNVMIDPVTSVPQHEIGEDGTFTNACNSPLRWLERSDNNLVSTLSCRARVGTSGPSIEMPLLMAKWSLAERAADTNAGFVRDDALLAIVMITDDDDRSTTEDGFTVQNGTSPTNFDPQDAITFLDALKGNRTRWAAGVIAGDSTCSTVSDDAVRLRQFVTLANGNGTTQATFRSICTGTVADSLEQILRTFEAAQAACD